MIKSLSCGIVIYDEIKEIQSLLPKLKIELSEYHVEWIFVLNHEQGEIRKWIANWLQSQIENCICLENPSNNLGFARQLLLETGSHQYIYLTDPDIDLVPGNLKKLIHLAHNEIINDANSKFVGYGGTVTHKSENYFIQATFDFMANLSKLIPFAFQIQTHKYLVPVDHIPACHILLNRALAVKIGGFSAALPKYGEDLDFTHRAYNEDYRFVFLPSAQVFHWQNLSLARWFYKIFNMGRIQIPVQKMNFKRGLRFYRLLPLLIFILFIGICAISVNFLMVSLISLFAASILSVGFLGFFLTFVAYSTGEFFETVLPLFEYKSEEELKVLNLNLKNQFFESNKKL
jgi:GT2 family glycosyltransferase